MGDAPGDAAGDATGLVDHLLAWKGRTQLCLAVVLNCTALQKRTHRTADPPPAATAASPAIRWPPASSAKSLPELMGRVSDLWKAEQASSSSSSISSSPSPGKRGTTGRERTIEFEVDQECKSMRSRERRSSRCRPSH